MKLPALLLAASLAANAALVFVLCRRGDPNPLPAPTAVPPALSSTVAAPGSASALPPGVTPRTWAALDTPDLRQIITRLRARLEPLIDTKAVDLLFDRAKKLLSRKIYDIR